MPGLDRHTGWDLTASVGVPECIPVVAVDPMNQSASLPPYLVVAFSMRDYLAHARPPLPIEDLTPMLKVMDFGNGALPLAILASRIHGMTRLL
jgi:hypothetical protein